MMTIMKKSLILLCLCVLLIQTAFAEGEDPLASFVLKHGDRNSPKVAITVDDCYKTSTKHIQKDLELCQRYGVQMTFFPVVYTGCLEPAYRDLWQSVLDAGCEIGSHSKKHVYLGAKENWTIVRFLGEWQEALDQTLGYHYETRWLRAPYGDISDKKPGKKGEARVTKMIRLYGYEHVVHWEISETKDLKKLMKKIKNGSILLFHASGKDSKFLETLIPALQEAGYQPVTLSELFGLEAPEISDELYVYDESIYREKEAEK